MWSLSPTGIGTKSNCAEEGQQQSTEPDHSRNTEPETNNECDSEGQKQFTRSTYHSVLKGSNAILREMEV
jgi:hypothetical protein